LWAIEAAAGEKSTSPGWLSFSPDGKAVAAVMVQAGAADKQVFTYTLRVWNAASRKERFSADLGRGKTQSWGDDLASFPSEETILTGGVSLVVRNLEDGSQVSTQPTNGTADHSVWAVGDLRDTFHLRREPDRVGKPVELYYHTQPDHMNDFRSSRIRAQNQIRQAEMSAPSAGMRTQAVTMNSARNQIVAAYRDDSPIGNNPRHALVLYRIKTIQEFDLDVIAESTNPHPGAVSSVAFARDGKSLASGGEDGSVCLWDVKNVGMFWKPRATVKSSDSRVVALAFSPDWRMVAAITWDKTKPNMLLIDADSGTLVRSVRLDRELTAVAWSPDGHTLLTGGYSGKLCAWDVDALLK
jgi:WD40 repeat protein